MTYYGVPQSVLTNVTIYMPHCGGTPCYANQVARLTGAIALNHIYADTQTGTVPLFTQTGAQQIFDAVYQDTLGNLATNIGSVNFGQLPNEAQVALADFAWNVNSGLLYTTSAGRTVQAYVENGQWLDLAQYLAANFKTRGGLEAGQIVQAITSGKLPESGQPCM